MEKEGYYLKGMSLSIVLWLSTKILLKITPIFMLKSPRYLILLRKWVLNNPEESVTIVAEALNMNRAIVEKAWDKHDWSAKLNQIISDDIQSKADFLSSQKKIKSPLNISDKLISKELLLE